MSGLNSIHFSFDACSLNEVVDRGLIRDLIRMLISLNVSLLLPPFFNFVIVFAHLFPIRPIHPFSVLKKAFSHTVSHVYVKPLIRWLLWYRYTVIILRIVSWYKRANFTNNRVLKCLWMLKSVQSVLFPSLYLILYRRKLMLSACSSPPPHPHFFDAVYLGATFYCARLAPSFCHYLPLCLFFLLVGPWLSLVLRTSACSRNISTRALLASFQPSESFIDYWDGADIEACQGSYL